MKNHEIVGLMRGEDNSISMIEVSFALIEIVADSRLIRDFPELELSESGTLEGIAVWDEVGNAFFRQLNSERTYRVIGNPQNGEVELVPIKSSLIDIWSKEAPIQD